MRFLGPCEVCGKKIHTYRGLGQHLRFNVDKDHQALKARWHTWKGQYKAILRCRKCGGLWDVQDSSLRHAKRCPRCEDLRISMSKRAYEKLKFDKPADPRQVMTASGSKAQWDGLKSRSLGWHRGDDLYKRVVGSFLAGDIVRTTLKAQSVTFKVYRAIVEDAVGLKAYKAEAKARKRARSSANIKKAHEKWAAMSPKEKAVEIAKRFRKGSALEKAFAAQLRKGGVSGLAMNQWQSLRIGGQWAPREADIKIPMGVGHKLVVLCDGEAFHGPRFAFGDVKARIADDVATANAYSDAGYSVVRYAESEVKNGLACRHLLSWLPRLRGGERLYRTWHPAVERVG